MRAALQKADAVEGLTRDELVEVAAEVGIPAADLDDAVEAIEREREVAEKVAQITSTRKRRFYRTLGNVAILGGTLAGIDYMLGPEWFVQYFGALSGMVLAFQARNAFLASPEDVEEQARKKLVKEWKKREWRRRERELPKVVEAGATALVEAAARKIAERLGGASGASRARGGAGPRVRVEPRPQEAPRDGAEPAEAELDFESYRERQR